MADFKYQDPFPLSKDDTAVSLADKGLRQHNQI